MTYPKCGDDSTDEKTLLYVLKKQIVNMTETMHMAESNSEKMLPTWFSIFYYEAEQIKLGIESYLKKHQQDKFKIFKAMEEAQKNGGVEE